MLKIYLCSSIWFSCVLQPCGLSTATSIYLQAMWKIFMRSGREDIDRKLQAESLTLISSTCHSLASVSKFVIVEGFFSGFIFVQLFLGVSNSSTSFRGLGSCDLHVMYVTQ